MSSVMPSEGLESKRASEQMSSPSEAKRPRLEETTSIDDATREDMALDVEGAESETGDNNKDSNSKKKGKRGRRGPDRKKEYKGRKGRSSYLDRTHEERQPSVGPDGEELPKAARLPKRQCALLLGFCGSGYSGMQIQPDHTRTIEGTLFKALVKIGAVSQDNADNPVKVGLARAARTDAGVHAAGNVVSLKMIMSIPGVDDIVAAVNQELPPEIRLWGYARTQNSFNARLVCESRKYTYFFPSYLLIPPKPKSNFYKIWSGHVASSTGADSEPSISYDFWDVQDESSSSTKEEDLARKRAWRIRPEQVESLRMLAYRYLGTHNFHNFTVGREFTDRSNNRYMKKIEVADPVVYGETEWIAVLFHGQSFMLHQRKMMAIMVLAARMGTAPRVISELYGQRSVFVPKMPALGLLLEEPLFDSYNQRMGVINEKFQPDDSEYRPLVDFDQYREKIDDFKQKYIYTNMRQVEDRDGLFDAWVRMIDAYAGNDLLYLNPSGAVPEAAVIVKGAKRDNPFREKKIFDATSFTEDGNIKKRLEEEDVDIEEEEEVLDKKHLEETEG